jgi:DNA-directed RNA polymerase subunit M/transcription elongation factor TFIIS
MGDLKACPFCGCDRIIYRHNEDGNEFFECDRCLATGPFSNAGLAKTNWNGRYIEDQLRNRLLNEAERAALAERERDGLRCCGNCGNGDRTGARQICVGCHGYHDVSPNDKKTYLANWRPRSNTPTD